jgi:hypothetical protein
MERIITVINIYTHIYHAKSDSSFLMATIVTIHVNAINEINKELTLTVCLFLLIFRNVTFLD